MLKDEHRKNMWISTTELHKEGSWTSGAFVGCKDNVLLSCDNDITFDERQLFYWLSHLTTILIRTYLRRSGMVVVEVMLGCHS